MKIDITITDTTTTITWSSTPDYYDYEQLQVNTYAGVSREILRKIKKILKPDYYDYEQLQADTSADLNGEIVRKIKKILKKESRKHIAKLEHV
jgi:hypothetical protein